ncbi:MAG: CopG family antitoxin [bacterium]|nr:CopG family antitoxin [bacterium]
MSKSKRDPIPSFKSVDEFQDFFDTHDLTDYEDVLKEVELEFSPKETRHINLFQIEDGLAKQIHGVASRKGVHSETLVNLWLAEKLVLTR